MKKLTTKGRDAAFIKQPDNVIWETHRTVAKELRPTGGRNAKNTAASSQKVFAFKCIVCKKTSKTRLVTKTRAIDEGSEKRACTGCGATPFNEGKSRGIFLSDELLAQLVPDPWRMPGSLPDSQLAEKMQELRLWQCPNSKEKDEKHTSAPFLYAATISARTRKKNQQDCPCCSYDGPRVNDDNRPLYAEYLETLVKDSRNRGYASLVSEFPLRYSAYFECAKGHVAYCSLEMMRRKKGCVTCHAHLLKGTNLADKRFSHLHDEFVCAPAYEEFGMQDIPAGSSKVVVRWRCKKDASHPPWLAYPVRRTRDERGCPYCGHKRLANGMSLAEKFPQYAEEFDSVLNLSPITGQSLSPNTIWCTDRDKYWFLCPVGHSYEATIVSRTAHGKGCTFCEVLPKSIFTLRPDLAAEWSTEKNEDEFPGVTAKTLTPGSNKKVWWVCSDKEKHEWLAMVKNRAKGSGCPWCYGRPAKKAKTIRELYRHLVKSFNNGGNAKKAGQTKAVLRNKYFWQCQCGERFERKLDDMIRRSQVCERC